MIRLILDLIAATIVGALFFGPIFYYLWNNP